MEPLARGDEPALLHVAAEDVGHHGGEVAVVDEGVDFEVVLEAAEVHVGRADDGQSVVDEQQLRVEEARLVEVDLRPGLEHVVEEGVGRQVDHPRVGAGREEQPHVDAGQRGGLERRVEHVGGEEVGGFNPDAPAGVGDGVAVGLEQRAPLAEGAAGEHLHDVVREAFGAGVVAFVSQADARGGGPVAQKRGLKPRHAGPLDAEVGVAPRPPVGADDVAVGDVHAADVARAAVDDGNLAVVAVVDLAGEERELDVEEGAHLDAGAAHLLEEALVHAAAPYVVVENPDFDPLARLGHQGVAQAEPRGVVVEDVVLEVDVVVRCGDVTQQRLHLRGAVDVGGDAASAERDGVARVAEQAGQRPVLGRELLPFVGPGLEQLHVDALAHAAREDAPLREVLSEEEVEDDPRQGLQRVPVVGDDDQNDAENRDRVDSEEEVCQQRGHRRGGGGRSVGGSAAQSGNFTR